MKKILVTRLLPPKAQAHLESLQQQGKLEVFQWKSYDTKIPRDVLVSNLADKHGLLVMFNDAVDNSLLQSAPLLECVATMSVGFDHIDTVAINARKIKLCNTPDVLTEATSELAIALLLMVSRKLVPALNAAKFGTWKPGNPIELCGTQIQDSRIGIIGFGRIGQSIAEKLVAFKPRQISYYSRAAKEVAFAELQSLDNLLRSSDIVIIACALNSETMGMFNKERLLLMKSDAILVNIARGGIINQSDLVEVLRLGHLGSVGLDVTDPEPLDVSHPLFTEFESKVLILPHVGSATMETRELMASLALNGLVNEITEI